MESIRDLTRAIELASTLVPGECICKTMSEEDELCHHCFITDVLTRCRLFVQQRSHVLDYTDEVNKAAIYPGKDKGIFGLLYAILGLVGEAGEVANAVKKELRDNQKVVDVIEAFGDLNLHRLGVKTDDIGEEIGDLMFYAVRAAVESGHHDLRQILGINIAKIREKRELILKERINRDHK